MRSWRQTVPIHPCAAVFPEISAEEKKELRKSIKATGLRNGITLWVDGDETYLLDGRSRLDALESLGIQVLDGDAIHRDHIEGEYNAISFFSAAQLVTSLNIRRRHLTAKQRAALAIKAIEAEKAMRKGITGEHSPVIGEQSKPPRQKGVRGSVKGDVSKVAEAAGVDKKTARRAIREARGEKPAKPKREKRQTPELEFWSTLDRMSRADLVRVRDYIEERLTEQPE